MKGEKGMLARFAEAASSMGAPLVGQTIVELLDNRRILIEHHSGVREYNDNHIQVRVSYGLLYISGDNLRLSKMSTEQLVITGCISSVTLTKER